MSGEEVTLIQMLDCRERRSHFQKELLKKYHCPVISFCMNIPGPIKTNKSICSEWKEHGQFWKKQKDPKMHGFP